MTEAELKNYHAEINDCWHFLKEFASFTGEKTETYWWNVIMEADAIQKKHDSEMVAGILSAMIGELQTKWRAERAERESTC